MICTPCKYCQVDGSRIKVWTRPVALNGKRRDAYRILVGKPDGKRQLGRPRFVWKDNIKIDIKVGSDGMAWIYLDHARVN